ncbi:MAG: hypoxanthine phosphoribosyltransferase [Eggerthellaceae bacterium]|nr:hypoxanthine phosphoribosyltransferase [Eggerthellaceae bacterium]
MHDDVERILFTKEQLAQRVEELGHQITEDYQGEPLVVVGILRGAAIIMSDLVRAIDLPLEMDFMMVSSYGDDTQSSGRVRIVQDISIDIHDKHVLIAEDVLDTGLTLHHLIDRFSMLEPRSVAVATLMRKATPGQLDVNCRYVGYECPNEFIVGYGLDYAQKYRNLPYIGVLKPEIYA